MEILEFQFKQNMYLSSEEKMSISFMTGLTEDEVRFSKKLCYIF